MSGFFVVKGELAAWALGLDQSDVMSADEVAEFDNPPAPPVPRRRKRRLGHEYYRTPFPRRRELIDR